MTRQDFLNQLKSDERLHLSDYACERLNIFLNAINEYEPKDTGLLENVILRLSTNTKSRIYTGEFFETLLKAVQSQAEFLAQGARIKGFKGTRYEETMLLKEHFLAQRLSDLKLTWIKQGEQA